VSNITKSLDNYYTESKKTVAKGNDIC